MGHYGASGVAAGGHCIADPVTRCARPPALTPPEFSLHFPAHFPCISPSSHPQQMQARAVAADGVTIRRQLFGLSASPLTDDQSIPLGDLCPVYRPAPARHGPMIPGRIVGLGGGERKEKLSGKKKKFSGRICVVERLEAIDADRAWKLCPTSRRVHYLRSSVAKTLSDHQGFPTQ